MKKQIHVVTFVCSMILLLGGGGCSEKEHACLNNDPCTKDSSCILDTATKTNLCTKWQTQLAASRSGDFPAATIGNKYEVDYTATGGFPPYNWHLNDDQIVSHLEWLTLVADGDTAKLQNIDGKTPLPEDIDLVGKKITITVYDSSVRGKADRVDNNGITFNETLIVNGCLNKSCCSNDAVTCDYSTQYGQTGPDSSNAYRQKCWPDSNGCISWQETDKPYNENDECTVSGDGTVSCKCIAGRTQCRQCETDSECSGGTCECADETCSATMCSSVSCKCGYTNDGKACTGSINSELNDIHKSCGSGRCDGNGNCRKADGDSCSNSSECRVNHYCECGGFNCTTRICSSKECKCQYADSSGQNCVGPITRGLAEFAGRCGTSDFCDGNGGCTVPDGMSCTIDNNCRSDHCECTDAGCSTTKCGEAYCSCQYNTDYDNKCDGPIDDGTDDPHHTCQSDMLCNGLGGCNIKNGDPCTANRLCKSRHCGCTTTSCKPAFCVPGECIAGPCWETDPSSPQPGETYCAYYNTVLDFRAQNPGDCDGEEYCNGGNQGCQLALSCNSNSDCTISNCCAASTAYVCGFNSGTGICLQAKGYSCHSAGACASKSCNTSTGLCN